MGDRVLVQINVREKDVQELIKNPSVGVGSLDEFVTKVEADYTQLIRGNSIRYFEQDEVNYAEWEALEDILRTHKIPYDKTHGDGAGYPGGTQYSRMINNQYETVFFVDYISGIYDSIARLIKNIDNHEKLKHIISVMKDNYYPFEPKALEEL